MTHSLSSTSLRWLTRLIRSRKRSPYRQTSHDLPISRRSIIVISWSNCPKMTRIGRPHPRTTKTLLQPSSSKSQMTWGRRSWRTSTLFRSTSRNDKAGRSWMIWIHQHLRTRINKEKYLVSRTLRMHNLPHLTGWLSAMSLLKTSCLYVSRTRTLRTRTRRKSKGIRTHHKIRLRIMKLRCR